MEQAHLSADHNPTRLERLYVRAIELLLALGVMLLLCSAMLDAHERLNLIVAGQRIFWMLVGVVIDAGFIVTIAKAMKYFDAKLANPIAYAIACAGVPVVFWFGLWAACCPTSASSMERKGMVAFYAVVMTALVAWGRRKWNKEVPR